MNLSPRECPVLFRAPHVVLPGLSSSPYPSSAEDHWVGTWATSPVALPSTPTASTEPPTPPTARSCTPRSAEIPHRIILTNEFGLTPLTINAAYIALGTRKGSEIDVATAHPVTFGGRTSVTIPPGALAVSDPTGLKLPALSDVAVSFVVPAQAIQQVTHHGFADQTSYTAAGKRLWSASRFDTPTEINNWPFLKGIDVKRQR